MKKLIITVIAIMAITALNLNILRATTDDNNQGLEPITQWGNDYKPCDKEPTGMQRFCSRLYSGECTFRFC